MGIPRDSDDIVKIILELSKISSQGLRDMWKVKCPVKSWQNQNCLSLGFRGGKEFLIALQNGKQI